MMPEKTEWKLSGQMMSLNVPLSESVASLKSKIQEETHMPQTKQKLFYDVGNLFNIITFFNIYFFAGYVL